jgi:hypothetical protein
MFSYNSILGNGDFGQITFLHCCLWLLGSYFVGFIIGQIYETTLAWFFKKRYDSIGEKRKQECMNQYNNLLERLEKPATKLKTNDLPSLHTMRGHLRHVDPADATRLLKVRAERRSCEVLIVGFIILWIVDIIFLFNTGRNLERIILLFCLPLLAVLYYLRALRAHKLLADGTTTAWLFSVLPQF